MGVLQGAGTGATIGSVIPGVGTAAGAIAGGIIGLGQSIGGWISGENKEKKQREHEKEMMVVDIEDGKAINSYKIKKYCNSSKLHISDAIII